eukprot:6550635-Pyramimonas_sp.AAC.1
MGTVRATVRTGDGRGSPPSNQPHLWRTMCTIEVVMWTVRATTGTVRATVSTAVAPCMTTLSLTVDISIKGFDFPKKNDRFLGCKPPMSFFYGVRFS